MKYLYSENETLGCLDKCKQFLGNRNTILVSKPVKGIQRAQIALKKLTSSRTLITLVRRLSSDPKFQTTILRCLI